MSGRGAGAAGTMASAEVEAFKAFIDGIEKNRERKRKFKKKLEALAESARSSATPQDCLELVTKALRIVDTHPDNCELQHRACMALDEFFSLNKTQELPMKDEVLKAAMKLMESHQQDAAIQPTCCHLLQLCFSLDPNQDTEMIRSSRTRRAVTGIILRVLNMHDSSTATQVAATYALIRLLCFRPENTAIALELGGLQALLGSMQALPHYCYIQVNGCAGLLELAEAGYAQVLWREQALTSVLTAMSLFHRPHEDSGDILEDFEYDRALLRCYLFISKMYSEERLQHHGSVRGIEVILDTMETHPGEPTLVGPALWATAMAISWKEDDTRCLRTPRCLKMVVDGMKAYPQDDQVQLAAFRAFPTLGEHVELSAGIGRLGAHHTKYGCVSAAGPSTEECIHDFGIPFSRVRSGARRAICTLGRNQDCAESDGQVPTGGAHAEHWVQSFPWIHDVQHEQA
jgi:hypothetical protein